MCFRAVALGWLLNQPPRVTDGPGRLAIQEIARRWPLHRNHLCASYAGYACLILAAFCAGRLMMKFASATSFQIVFLLG